MVSPYQPQQSYRVVAQVFADVLHQGQRILQCGGSIDQHQRTVAGARQQCARVLGRGGLLHREGAPLHLQALLCQSQSGLCLGAAAHQQHLPAGLGRRGDGHRRATIPGKVHVRFIVVCHRHILFALSDACVSCSSAWGERCGGELFFS